MFTFTLDGIKRMGEPHETYGQAYWCSSPDLDEPIKFNSMDDTLEEKLESGPVQIVAEEKSERQSAKGTTYIQLKKVKLVEKVAEPGGALPESRSNPAGHPNEQLDRIEQKLEEIIALLLPESS